MKYFRHPLTSGHVTLTSNVVDIVFTYIYIHENHKETNQMWVNIQSSYGWYGSKHLHLHLFTAPILNSWILENLLLTTIEGTSIPSAKTSWRSNVEIHGSPVGFSQLIQVLLLPPESLALYPLSWRTRQRWLDLEIFWLCSGYLEKMGFPRKGLKQVGPVALEFGSWAMKKTPGCWPGIQVCRYVGIRRNRENNPYYTTSIVESKRFFSWPI